MSEVRIAIIGGGVIGRRHAGAINEVEGVTLVGIVDPAPSGAALAQDLGVPLFTEVEDMIAKTKPHGAIISTPTEHHFRPTLAVLEAGLPALVEKPIMATLEEADQIVAKSEATGLPVLVGHHRRYYPQVHKAREIVRDGTLGQLVAVSGQWTVRKNVNYYDPDWRKKWQAGPILTNLIHEVDSLRYVCGEVETISAEISHQVMEVEKEDAAAMVLRFANGALGTFIVSDQATSPWAWEFATGETPAFPKSGQNAVRLMGTKAALDFPNLALWHHGEGAPDWNHAISKLEMPHDLPSAYHRQIDHFRAVISQGAEPRITAADATATLRTTLAVYDAAREGKRVVL